ncbi:uncharacterized protein EKO05_0006464 [Ascochyta rabiei]|uniref:Uncharacterized protein n=1 Tax=Didymella rabiei TaxID=5454 RepID=A0A162W753_DIDRA|nr:uncharacterized protein EKO05_0006464 [Ascochyta rabiei]KZM18844.1 hypothetical protein ST47_g10177 [Ascochyta rabiei]UPX16039.1 hypothetical protein EKO05_0006464 [Ascochyta rabiei]
MLPPVDPATLRRNPNFELLYKDLRTRKLNPDGSTRDTKKQRMHDEIRRSLTTARSTLLSTQILITTLATLPSRAPTLPDELHACIDLISALLSGQIPDPSDREILSGDVTIFLDNVDIIASAISTQLETITQHLCTIASPLSPPAPASLSTNAEELVKTATLDLPQELAATRTELTNSLTSLLALHKSVLETSIRILEQIQHGSLARHTKARAELLHSRATLLGLQARCYTFGHPPPAEFVAALKEFRKSQGTGERALRDREALARQSLKLYDQAGERGIRELAKRKMYLDSETGRIEKEIVSLERGG